MLEPLLGQHAPAVDDFPAALDVRSLCHEKVRKEENGRQRNGTNQSAGTPIFCGKLLCCPATAPTTARLSTESVADAAAVLPIHSRSGRDMVAMRPRGHCEERSD